MRELELTDGPALADVLLVLGRTQAAQQQLSEAEDHLRHCLRIRCVHGSVNCLNSWRAGKLAYREAGRWQKPEGMQLTCTADCMSCIVQASAAAAKYTPGGGSTGSPGSRSAGTGQPQRGAAVLARRAGRTRDRAGPCASAVSSGATRCGACPDLVPCEHLCGSCCCVWCRVPKLQRERACQCWLLGCAWLTLASCSQRQLCQPGPAL